MTLKDFREKAQFSQKLLMAQHEAHEEKKAACRVLPLLLHTPLNSAKDYGKLGGYRVVAGGVLSSCRGGTV